MFQPCPRCGFLVALISPRGGATEQRCPRCGEVLVSAQPQGDTAHEPTRVQREPPAARGTPASVSTSEPVPAEESERRPVPGREPADRSGAAARPGQERPAPPAQSAAPSQPSFGRTAPTNAPGPARNRAPHMPGKASITPAPARPRRIPSFVRGTDDALQTGERPWRLYTAIGALALVLALQLLLAQRDRLAGDARWRPAVTAACRIARCEVAPWREPTAFTMLDRSVQPRPDAAGVLSAQATFRNDAAWPQPWPTLVLSLSGVDGRTLGARAFEPHEYAGAAATPLAPGQSASVQMDIVEPAPDVVAFAFDFR